MQVNQLKNNIALYPDWYRFFAGAYRYRNSSENLRIAAEYFQVVANHLDCQEITLGAPPEMLEDFEFVCALVLNSFSSMNDPRGNGVRSILEKHNFGPMLRAMAKLSRQESKRGSFAGKHPHTLRLLGLVSGGRVARRNSVEKRYRLLPCRLQTTKEKLLRISKILSEKNTGIVH